MQAILTYFQDFFQQTNKAFLIFCTLLSAGLVVANYKLGIETRLLAGLPNRPAKFAGFYGLYLLAFGIPYVFYIFFVKPSGGKQFPFLLILLAPAIFALKVTAGGWQEAIQQAIPDNNGRFLAIITDWPIRLLITSGLLTIVYFFVKTHFNGEANLLALNTQNFKWAPYLLLLAAMIPLVGFAACQPAFLHAYPKLKALNFLAPGGPSAMQTVLYELSYGSDFLTIEIFFRGFLVVLLGRYAGPAAILPMAVFYCSIHFGKPMPECISSYFGGIILGIIACYSQSILGGIVVHLGLAWMMELAAILATHCMARG
jgi:hypothetical protein